MFVAIAASSLSRESPYHEMISDLNREKRAIGLDHALSPGQLLSLERCARRWERIENALSGAVWKSQPQLAERVERKAFDCMLQLVAYATGKPGTPWEARGLAERLLAISRAMDTAAAALESYRRPTETTAGIPAGAAFHEVKALEALL